jgi:hypothetical protein
MGLYRHQTVVFDEFLDKQPEGLHHSNLLRIAIRELLHTIFPLVLHLRTPMEVEHYSWFYFIGTLKLNHQSSVTSSKYL